MRMRSLGLALLLGLNLTAHADPSNDEKLLALTDSCAGNDNGNVDKVDIQKFSVNATLRKIKTDDKDRGCQERIYSTDKAKSIRIVKSYLLGKFDKFAEYSADCIKSELSKNDLKKLLRLVEDRTNIAVVVNAFDDKASEANSEACAYYHFHIVRKNGNVVRIVFDHTT